ncbi:hypothetical protein [Marinibacterium profundimaris]|uniref:Phytanoyl-CoA dioxygenase n=1 Tax=Marinibacterium profundimaris TaxID=1679460 RepID=A0A225NUK5_9RHOB|nr:hypothetical protein [Marinibacterium profundimaris]OWU77217.1 hypothetical protein ATO3_00245 [Marinibacterium profundimaris]
MLGSEGYRIYPVHAGTLHWAATALAAGRRIAADPEVRRRNLRHGETWFVGVDALPTGTEGDIQGVPLDGPFHADLPPLRSWPLAQLSIVYPGYPGRDPGESDGGYIYRLTRAAAHVDGLLRVGAEGRRYPLELHGFILGLPLTEVRQAPTLCWPGSHRIIGDALVEAVGDQRPEDVDVTDAYVAARRQVLDRIRPVPLVPPPGGSFLLHRFTLHGTGPWEDDRAEAPDGRMTAFFRPEVATAAQWLRPDWS